MNKKIFDFKRALIGLASFALLGTVVEATAAEGFVAGLAPYQRPAGAPTVTAPTPFDAPGSVALHGVSQPIPQTMVWLRDQGNWYTPFTRPGMVDRYDIRGWHSNPPAVRK